MNGIIIRSIDLVLTIVFILVATYLIRVVNDSYFKLGDYIYSIWAVIGLYLTATSIDRLLKGYNKEH